MKLNESLTKEFVTATNQEVESPLKIRINSLKQQKHKHQLAQEIKIQDIRQEKLAEQQVLENQITLLESELKLMQDEIRNLTKFSSAPGVIKNVFVKPGEQVSAYAIAGD